MTLHTVEGAATLPAVPQPDKCLATFTRPAGGLSAPGTTLARSEAIASNARVSKNGGRFWQLSGGLLRCGGCGWSMKTVTVKAGNSEKRNHYYRCTKQDNRQGMCPNNKCHRAGEVESRVWEAVSGILNDPEQLRADLDAMIELERGSVRGNLSEEVRLWADKLAEVERKRARYQEMAASDLITFEELRQKLAELDDARATAERELEAIRDRRSRLEELERDRDAVLQFLVDIAPEALDSLTPEERNHFYKMLRLQVAANQDGSLEVSGAFGGSFALCKGEPLSRSP